MLGGDMADEMRATPLSRPALKKLADAIYAVDQFARKPFGYNNPPAAVLSDLLGLPAAARTAERAAYGEPLTTGRGMTTRLRPDTEETMLNFAPGAAGAVTGAARAASPLAMAAGRAGERVAERVVPKVMERGGLPADVLQGMAHGSRSHVMPKAPADDRLETARRNAVEMLGLPENNTPMDRARALGFTDNVYHGTKNLEPIKNLIPGGANGAATTGDAYGLGVYTSTDAIGDASSYGAQGGVLPLMIRRANHLMVDSPSAADLEKLSKFAGEQLLPSDKARFAIGRETRQFKDVQDARDFFDNQRANWNQFGAGYDRARPEAVANPDGTFAVEFTNFDAPIPITNGEDVQTLLKAVGWDNVPSLGYSGHTLDRGNGRLWDITTDTSKLRSRFAAFDPARVNENDLLAGGVGLGLTQIDPAELEKLMQWQKQQPKQDEEPGYAAGGSVYNNPDAMRLALAQQQKPPAPELPNEQLARMAMMRSLIGA
jgi:hypothetical protein